MLGYRSSSHLWTFELIVGRYNYYSFLDYGRLNESLLKAWLVMQLSNFPLLFSLKCYGCSTKDYMVFDLVKKSFYTVVIQVFISYFFITTKKCLIITSSIKITPIILKAIGNCRMLFLLGVTKDNLYRYKYKMCIPLL